MRTKGDFRHDIEERIGIYMHDAGLPREEAESKGFIDTYRYYLALGLVPKNLPEDELAAQHKPT